MDTIKTLDPNTGAEFNIRKPVSPEATLNEFVNQKSVVEPNTFLVERDFMRVLMPLFFNIPVNKEAFCQNGDEYLNLLIKLYKRAKKGEITVRLACIHQVYIGAERRNYLIKNIGKKLVSSYSENVHLPVTDDGTPSSFIVRKYIPTVFALHFHKDSQNPYVAYNMFAHLRSPIKPTPLHSIPNDLFDHHYRRLA